MSVDRREFLKRLSLGIAVLAPAALIAGCPREEADPAADPTPPTPGDAPTAAPDAHEGHDHAGGSGTEGEAAPVLGTDPAKAPEGTLAFECPECHQMNALAGHEEGAELPKIKCRVCGEVWQPE